MPLHLCDWCAWHSQRLFRAAVDELARYGEPINRVLEVDIQGQDVTFDLYELP